MVKDLFHVGVAMKPEKQAKHISQRLLDLALQEGIQITTIDINAPLSEQGIEFDVILQKVRRPEFEQQLDIYTNTHPSTRICDPPRSTHRLRNRFDMLKVASDQGFILSSPSNAPHWPLSVQVCAPSHTTLGTEESFHDAKQKIESLHMKYPILVKCLWADGRPGSHSMAVIHSDEGLQSIIDGAHASSGLSPPILLEQYVYHGSCLFKVYVIGSQSILVTRPSLQLDDHVHDYHNIQTVSAAAAAAAGEGNTIHRMPQCACNDNDSNTTLNNSNNNNRDTTIPTTLSEQQQQPPHIQVLPERISAYPRSRSWGKDNLAPKGHGVPALPEWLWKGIAHHLREQLGLTLFNFDLIVPLVPPDGCDGLLIASSVDHDRWEESWNGIEKKGLLHLIDINYYPGIEKLPKSEEIMIEFLQELRKEQSILL